MIDGGGGGVGEECVGGGACRGWGTGGGVAMPKPLRDAGLREHPAGDCGHGRDGCLCGLRTHMPPLPASHCRLACRNRPF